MTLTVWTNELYMRMGMSKISYSSNKSDHEVLIIKLDFLICTKDYVRLV